MKKKKMEKDSFARGTAVSYVSIVLTKLLGLVYTIPFYRIIGEKGGFIYSAAYGIYALFLDISTSGLPTVMSIICSEYMALGKNGSKERAFHLARRIMMALSVLMFVVLQIFAPQIARFYVEDMQEGATIEEVSSAVRAVSFSLLMVPPLSLRCGYMQGHKFMTVPFTADVIEQVGRIAVVLLGSYTAVYILKLGVSAGVDAALLGPFIGALLALIYVTVNYRRNIDQFPTSSPGETIDNDKTIIQKLFRYCLVIIIVTVANSVYNITDMKLLITGLRSLGYSDVDTQTISSVASTWVPKICNIVSALATALTLSIAPHMADGYARRDYDDVNNKIQQAIGIILAIAVPIAAGMMILGEPVFRVFYGYISFGPQILQIAVVVSVLSSLTSVLSMALQSMNKGKVVLISTLSGIGCNVALDLPLIYLCESALGKGYIGATISSVIAQSLTLIMLLVALKKEIGFQFSHTAHTIQKLFLPFVVMVLVVSALYHFWGAVDGRNIWLILQLGAYALVGMIVYFPIGYKTNAFAEVVGADAQNKILRKLHLLKSE